MKIEQHGARKFEDLAHDIMQWFDFEKVHKCMLALNWNWQLGKTDMGIPNLETIKRHAYEYLKKAYEKKCQTGSGGFMAGYLDGHLYLTFTLEEWAEDDSLNEE